MSDVIRILPAIALRGMVILPQLVVPVDISRKKSISALEHAMESDQTLFLTAQKETEKEDPGQEDLYETGVLARIRQVVKGQNNNVRILVEGIQRARLYAFTDCEEFLEAQVLALETDDESLIPAAKQAMMESVQENFRRYANVQKMLPKGAAQRVAECKDLEHMIDLAVNQLQTSYDKKQPVLEETNLERRYRYTLQLIFDEVDVQILKNDYQAKVKHKIDEHQKEYILREQMSVIRDELGESDSVTEADEFAAQLEKLNASEEVKEQISREIKKFRSMNPNSGESSIIRNYIETLLDLPWNAKSEDNGDLDRAEMILNRDHFGLEKVKDRILDFLAVRSLTQKGESPIICLVGPPGTGKTSIARSIAESLEKKYVRVCLGGVHDEAEIRGHRRTYVGAMPGRIVDGLRQAKVSNPLMLLDEIDKASGDYKGDTSSALLEVLDGEQNSHFRDHFVDIPIDLSEVLFLATANDMSKIPRPLLDRMEIIEISGYTENEKFHIAKEHLLKKQQEVNGISPKQLSVTDEALKEIIRGYTREAGVRSLERRLGEICRKTARQVYRNQETSIEVTPKNLPEFLGQRKYDPDMINEEDEAGIVRGLAWTAVGGVTLEVEVNVMPGKGELKLTGQLGDVMKESAQAGISYIRSIAADYGIDAEYFNRHDIHIHIPEGATPKDGPSAGITMATAMLSAITERPVRADVAMTGEITLRGRVLPIGGLKEKLLAAKNAGIRTVCIPFKNRKDLEDISGEITDGLEIVPVKTLKEVLAIAFVQE